MLNETLRDAQVSHSIGLQRLSNATTRKALKLLERAERRIVERLASQDITDFTQARLERLLEQVRRILAGEYERMTEAVAADLRELSGYEVEYQADLFRRSVPVELNFVIPSDAQVWAAVNSRPFQGRILKDWFKDLSADAFARLRNTIRQGYVEGLTTEQIVREVRGTARLGYNDGILATNRRIAETTVRTALTHTANSARERLYDANQDLIKGVQWVSTLDGRTSAVCRARDGQVYPPDKGPRPPAHPNCRSSTTPVVKSWAELGLSLKDAPPGTRASMNGQVPATETYETWLRKQPREFQDDVLGEKKAKLWRNGGLTLDRFVDRAGQEYTLDELRRREREAFERAGV